MTIYLYVKTHLDTGLKYLGKTNSPNPHTYKGSGFRWRNHIKKHGYNVKTEILKECSSNEEIRVWGEYYSNLWNIVESKDWANIKPESGNGGIYTEEIAKKISISNTGQKRSAESKERMRKAALGKKFSEEHKKKLAEARQKRTIKYQHSEETKRKIKESNLEHWSKNKRTAWNKGKEMPEETRQKLRKPKKKEKILILTSKPKYNLNIWRIK